MKKKKPLSLFLFALNSFEETNDHKNFDICIDYNNLIIFNSTYLKYK
jgi:hypothetical protein